ncbi:MAG TPA: CorA family divalent cation transporter [Pyrinomonadaceae bacterium]|nr:CorA family divalent cation transporter [Pyrinomonadaceae bacterium]
MDIKAYLYDAAGNDEVVKPEDVDIRKLKSNQLLWINVLERDEQTLRRVAKTVSLEGVPFRTVMKTEDRPRIENYGHFFRFSISSVRIEKGKSPMIVMIDYIVGKNFVVTVHEGEIEYFEEFRKREKGETEIGRLDAESFLATLLDLHIVSYFHAMEEIEQRVDKFDERILRTDIDAERLLADMVKLRRDVSDLRRWLLPHRDVLYSLTRADFLQIAESSSADEFKRLTDHFESAADAIERLRETVLGVFELYATKSAQLTNTFVQRLTFLTLLTGSLAVFSGVLGMNFKADLFDHPNGFWLTVAGLVTFAVGLTMVARYKRWI